jgi:peptidyl-prolyl cis-trans isomerase SurA
MIASVNKQVTDLFYDSKWELPKDSVAFSSKLFTINTTEISGYSFLKYIKNQEKRAVSIKPITKLTSVLLEDFVDEQLNKYNNDNLENEHPEFAAVMEEYRDGLLLFELISF